MSTRATVLVLGALGLLAALVLTLALGVGTTSTDLAAVWRADPLVLAVRLPRVLLAALAGAGLAAAGVAFQALLRNPLADPYVVGVSGGAALGGVLALVLGLSADLLLPLCAFAGAVLSALAMFGLARAAGRTDALTLLLVGVVWNAFAAAVVTFIKTVVSATKAQEILFWLMGVIEVLPATSLVALALYLAIGAAVLIVMAGTLNLLATSDDEAAALGVDVDRARLIIFLAATLLVGATVATTGMVGFVGLVVPHVLRRLLGADHRLLLPASLFAGAMFLVIADALARLTFQAFGTELPVGVITAATGGPFFLALLLRPHRRA
ncbi:MAG: iron ABC transporter permease [Deltaproteobacteria bacterium]|nr:iron ABC transporter permease [Deltaproteobacteria bacterium]